MAQELPSASEVKDALPQSGKNAYLLGSASNAVQIINGVDMVLGYLGMVPPGAIPLVANGIVAIIGGLTSWWAKRKATASALVSTPPRSLSSY
jgi:hypothetical protein